MNTFDPFISSEYHNKFIDDTPLESEPNLTKKTESEFLSQILSSSFSDHHKDMKDHTEPYTIAERQSQNSHDGQSSHSVVQSQESKKSSSKISPFHNFQKHLVITLRQILTLKGLAHKSGVGAQLAEKIFTHFRNSQKTSRKFLQQIYGLYEVKGSYNCTEFIKTLRKGELSEIIEKEKDETIMEAHMILRQLTKLELEEGDIQEVLSHRKIEKKRQFIEYVNLFKRELVEGKQRKKAYKLIAKKFSNE